MPNDDDDDLDGIVQVEVEVTLLGQLSKVGKWGWKVSNLDFLYSRLLSLGPSDGFIRSFE